MDIIKIHVLHCGQVKTTRWLPFNKDQVSMAKVAGLFVPEKTPNYHGFNKCTGITAWAIFSFLMLLVVQRLFTDVSGETSGSPRQQDLGKYKQQNEKSTIIKMLILRPLISFSVFCLPLFVPRRGIEPLSEN